MKFLPLALLCALSATTASAAAATTLRTTTISSKAPFIRRAQEDDCAGDGDRAQECGAANADRPQNCCEGFVCAGRGSVRCVAEDGADVAANAEGEDPADADSPTVEEKEDVEEPMEEEEEPEPEPEPVEDDTNCAKVSSL